MLDEVRTRGFAVVHRPDWVASIPCDPWDTARAICGDVRMVERQPIKPVPHGRSFASRIGDAPLHTDSQLFCGAPADFQILGCVRPARRGGESLLFDTRTLMEAAEEELRGLLFGAERTFRFVFGDLVATTLAVTENGALVFTHSPRSDDAVAKALRPLLHPPMIVRLGEGDVIVVDNHRMLHGRAPFEDDTRELQRLLVWSARPFDAPTHLFERARREGRSPTRLADREATRDLSEMRPIVEAMLGGVPPGVLAIRHGIPEAHLYVYRDRLYLGRQVEEIGSQTGLSAGQSAAPRQTTHLPATTSQRGRSFGH